MDDINRHVAEAMAERFSVTTGEYMDAMGILPKVNGTPIYEYAKSHKNDLDMMLECCRAIENVYWSYGSMKMSPEPGYFERAAILSGKARDYSGEVAICERWIDMAEDFKKWLKTKPKGVMADVTKGPVSKRIYARLPKAQAKL
ncbi:hypothetical protein [Vreelandella maris]|uniref:hypothetical protein n=1 Tax=Vreelandella maris TaxID=2729617 RepID=UPI0030EE9175|tara:strand:+ start:8276 stop:8707 length:432 start_codon:yes stop_codon:yes gene_type:complete